MKGRAESEEMERVVGMPKKERGATIGRPRGSDWKRRIRIDGEGTNAAE